eukprot:5879738-Prymnesium_polylepis.2
MVSYGSSCSDPRAKQKHYEGVYGALRHVIQAHGHAPTVWMADHNMVMNATLDEERGTAAPTGQRQSDLREAVLRVEALLEVEYSFRAMHGVKVAFTHCVRRIDRTLVSKRWVTEGRTLPRLVDARHVKRIDSEYVVRERSEWCVVRHEHKAVDIVVRFTETEREPAPWKFRGYRYPSDVWKQLGRQFPSGLSFHLSPDARTRGMLYTDPACSTPLYTSTPQPLEVTPAPWVISGAYL